MKPEGYKPFSEGNYDKYSPLEEQVKSYLYIYGMDIVSNPDKYDIDLLIVDDGDIIGGIEVESHAKYWDDEFPFDTVHFLGRKLKYTQAGSFYLMVSAELKNAVIIHFPDLYSYDMIEKDNESCDNEPFIEIPKDDCVFGWHNINLYLNRFYSNL
jgi:hypothetical protein